MYKIGYIAGVFDLFHVGHLNLIKRAKEQCEYLIVGVLSDELVLSLKKVTPYITFIDRKEIIEAIEYVNEVVEVNGSNIDKISAWKLYRFDCLFSGDDWKNNEGWIEDKRRLNDLGVDVVFFTYTKGISSTNIKNSLNPNEKFNLINQELIHNLKRIYNRLGDGLSKYLFEKRLMYSCTGEYQYIIDMIRTTKAAKNIEILLNRCKSEEKKVIIYGAGNAGKYVLHIFSEYKFWGFCDKNAKNIKEKGINQDYELLTPEELYELDMDYTILISTPIYYEEIYRTLIDNGVEHSRIINYGKEICDMRLDAYFDLDELHQDDDEVFVDAGCYDCSTTYEFIKWSNNNYDKIIAFEPDNTNYNNCLQIVKKLKRVEVHECCLWNEEVNLRFMSEANDLSRVIEQDYNSNIKAKRLDDILDGDRVSFIKMDIEGSEVQALIGAENTIRKYRPKLAICIYHKDDDIWKIPLFILSIHADYKLYIRHYNFSGSETVLYAI